MDGARSLFRRLCRLYTALLDRCARRRPLASLAICHATSAGRLWCLSRPPGGMALLLGACSSLPRGAMASRPPAAALGRGRVAAAATCLILCLFRLMCSFVGEIDKVRIEWHATLIPARCAPATCAGCAAALPTRRQRCQQRQRSSRPACSTAAATGLDSSGSRREAVGRPNGSQAGSGRLQASSVELQQRPQTTAQPPSSGTSSASGGSSSSGAAWPDSSSSRLPRGSSAVPSCRVRPAEPGDYWAIADLHCMSFYPRATFFWFAALRMDRVMSLQMGEWLVVCWLRLW